MENLHTKQQNVVRRKLEEAVASNKRLRDVLEKQKNARKISREIIDNKGGLAGAAERMRNVVTQVCRLFDKH
jgi:kinesin family protein 4/21/27